MFDQHARGIAAGRDAKPFTRRIGMGFDGAFADLEDARDFLRLKVLCDQPQDLFLALGQGVDAGECISQNQFPRGPSTCV